MYRRRGGAEKVFVTKIDLNKSKVLQITSGEAQRAETSALVLQASLFQEEHSHTAEPLCLCCELKWFWFLQGSCQSLPVSPPAQGSHSPPGFMPRRGWGTTRSKLPAPMESWRSSQHAGTREDSDLGLFQKEKPQLWKLFEAGLSQLSCLEFHGDSPAAQKRNSRFPFPSEQGA